MKENPSFENMSEIDLDRKLSIMAGAETRESVLIA